MKKLKKSKVILLIVNLIKEYKKEFFFIIGIAMFGSILSAFIPYIYGRLFDLALIPNTSISLLISLVLLWAILGLISNYTSAKTFVIGSVLGAKLSIKLEIDAYSHFLTLPISFHKDKKTGEVLNRISRGSWHLDQFIGIVSSILPSLFFVIFAIIAMSILQWQLAIIVIFSFILYSLVTLKQTKQIVKCEEKMMNSFEKQYGFVYDKLYNVFLIKNFSMEENEKKRFYDSLIGKALPPYKLTMISYGKLRNVQGIIYNLSFVLLLGIAIFFLRKGQITQGEFVMFFGYINLSFGPFFRLSEFYNFYKRAFVALRRIIRLKDMLPESYYYGNKIIKDFKGNIHFKNVSFGYLRNKKILRNINIKIKSGESVALVGESGVGKSTFSELIFGYWKPTKGKIYLDNIEISKLSLKWLREQIAIVPQEISILNDRIINNLKYANPKASFEDIVKAAKAANAHNFIMRFPKKYNTYVGERGVKLSVGQKQRIAITMAFLKNPKILILDEPTSALDAKSEKYVQEGIKRLIAGRTSIIIAHRFSTVKNVDKIIVLDKGRIVEVGNHDELMKRNGKYYELYTLQKGLD